MLDGLCEMYVDPATGANRCAELQNDRRCGLSDIHKQIVLALSEDTAEDVAKEAASGLCSCSCWADIVDVYQPVFAQVCILLLLCSNVQNGALHRVG